MAEGDETSAVEEAGFGSADLFSDQVAAETDERPDDE